MYEHFNPFDPADAGWPYALLLLGALALGYVIGFVSRRRRVTALETQRDELEAALEASRTAQAPVPATARATPPPGVPLAAAVPPVPEQVPMDNAFLTTAVLSEVVPDDLTVIEGIGPAIAALLREAGIDSFRGLAQTPANHLTGVLRAAGPRYQIHDPGTWPEQARLAVEGQWDELKTYQATLDAGRA